LSSNIEQAVYEKFANEHKLDPHGSEWSVAAAISQARLCAKSLAWNTTIPTLFRLVNPLPDELFSVEVTSSLYMI